MNELLTNCCTVPFIEPRYPDSDVCSKCKEHAGVIEDENLESAIRQHHIDEAAVGML